MRQVFDPFHGFLGIAAHEAFHRAVEQQGFLVMSQSHGLLQAGVGDLEIALTERQAGQRHQGIGIPGIPHQQAA